MARDDELWDRFEKWATEHALDFEAPDVQDVFYTWVEIFSSDPIASDEDSLNAFRDFLRLSGFDEDEIEDIVDEYAHD